MGWLINRLPQEWQRTESVPMVDLSAARLQPYAHQIEGVRKLVERPVFALFDEMGAGKTKQTIDAAQVLYTRGLIRRVVVVAPAAVRSVWFDPEMGELKKHLWLSIPSHVWEYHARNRNWHHECKPGQPALEWTITNYDYIRSEPRLEQLLLRCDKLTLLVLDESSAVKNHKALQTKASLQLRKKCGRVVLLNGTPIANSPLDMYSQGNILDGGAGRNGILGCQSFFQFRAKYALMGGFQNKQIIGWRMLEDMQKRFAPYVLRRLKEQCLDLPPKLDSIVIDVPLTAEVWGVYKEMRDEMVAYLTDQTVSVASQAIVKALRLAQVTSGYLGGITEDQVTADELSEEDRPHFIPLPADFITPIKTVGTGSIREIGSEKLDAFLSWFKNQLIADPNLKVLVFCRFRPELNRLVQHLSKFKGLHIGEIRGGQKPFEREASTRLLDPRTMPPGPVAVVCTTQTGSVGLNLAGAHTVIYISNDYSLFKRQQSEDRVHRPGQKYPVSYFDVVATGPQGQKTIDHTIQKALRNKLDIAKWTTGAWVSALLEE
jgi:SNF2 family DNA or RNA helicase